MDPMDLGILYFAGAMGEPCQFLLFSSVIFNWTLGKPSFRLND